MGTSGRCRSYFTCDMSACATCRYRWTRSTRRSVERHDPCEVNFRAISVASVSESSTAVIDSGHAWAGIRRDQRWWIGASRRSKSSIDVASVNVCGEWTRSAIAALLAPGCAELREPHGTNLDRAAVFLAFLDGLRPPGTPQTAPAGFASSRRLLATATGASRYHRSMTSRPSTLRFTARNG